MKKINFTVPFGNFCRNNKNCLYIWQNVCRQRQEMFIYPGNYYKIHRLIFIKPYSIKLYPSCASRTNDARDTFYHSEQ